MLVGENGPEIVIDSPTLKNLDPEVINKIYATAARVRGYESGNYPTQAQNPASSTQNQTTPALSETSISMLTEAINSLVNNGVVAKNFYGLDHVKEIGKLQKTYSDTINESRS
jgi:hypothetical protein